MGYHPRIECSKIASFQTTRSRNSELWFVNNLRLENAILGYAARYTTRYRVDLFALAIEGNHVQKVALFPKANRSQFMRDFNSSIARAIPRFQNNYPGGRFWGRRYSSEFLPGNEDVEDRFFYTVLQPVNDGLVDDIHDYPGYNCFEDAVTGTTREFKVVRWKAYNDARRRDPSVPIEKFTDICTLRFARLPGYEGLSQSEYQTLMRKKLAERTRQVLLKRQSRKCLGAQRLRDILPGSSPARSKQSGPKDRRPRILSICPIRRSIGEAWYFGIYFRYKESSKRFRSGEISVTFPNGTYKPPAFTTEFTDKLS